MLNNGINTASKTHLHGSPHLAAVDLCSHHCAKGPDIIEVVAHEPCDLLSQRLVLGKFFVLWLYFEMLIRLAMLSVQYSTFANIDVVPRLARLNDLHVVSDLTFDGNIRYQTVTRFRINARKIASVGISVWIAILNVKEENKLVSMFDRMPHVDHSFESLF